MAMSGSRAGAFSSRTSMPIGCSAMPRVDVHLIESGAEIGGVGEAGVPPIAPALANAIFAAAGRPVHKLPI